MMKYWKSTILIVVCWLLLAPVYVEAQKASNAQLYKITHEGKSGFIDQTGKIVIPAKFDRYMISDFSEGLAELKDMKALPDYPFSKEGFMDSSGNIVIKPQFDVAYDFSNGRAQVRIGDLTSFIDKTGKQVIKLGPYQGARSFHEGLAAVSSNFEFWYIDPDGKILIPKQIGMPKDFSEGLACVYLPVDGKLKAGYIDKTGKVVISPQFDEGFDFSEGLAPVKINEKYGFVNKEGKLVVAAKYKSAYGFRNGRARVSSGDKYGFIDSHGNMVIKEIYESSGDFSEELAPACSNDKCGYIDATGKQVIEPRFEYAFEFRGGLAMVNYGTYIDKTGKVIWQATK